MSGDGTGDHGEADPAVLAALDGGPDAEVIAVLAPSRLLVPVVSVVGEAGAEVAAVTLTAPDGQRAMPVFTGVVPLAAWDPGARPVPVTASAAARAAIQDGCEVLLVDLGSPHHRALRASMVWALAIGRPWVAAHDDEHVLAAVSAAVRDESVVTRHTCEAGDAPGVLRVVLHVPPGLDEAAVSALATRMGERLATDGELRARIDGLAFAVTAG